MPRPSANVAPAPAPFARTHEERVSGADLEFAFRVSPWSNLFYQLDCLAELTSCSRDAYEREWNAGSGGLDAGDHAALVRWREIRSSYHGNIQIGDDGDPELPVPNGNRGVGAHIQLAAVAAGGPERFRDYERLFMAPGDVAEASAIIDRFSARFARAFAAHDAAAAEQAGTIAVHFRKAHLDAFIAQVARFYGSGLPPRTELDFELIARPESGAAWYATNRGPVSFVELAEPKKIDDQLAVITHELFHYLFASAPRKELVALANRFATSSDPLSYPAWGLFDEALAAALGNGLVMGKLDAATLQKNLQIHLGLFYDDFVDPVGRQLLQRLPALLDEPAGVFSDRYFDAYMASVHAAFPDGLAPRAYLRPWVCFYDPRFQDSYVKLGRIARSPIWDYEDTVAPERAKTVLDEKKRWSRVFLLHRSDLAQIARLADAVGKDTVAAVQARARRPGDFVVARSGAPVAFVFVASDAPGMEALVQRFTELTTLRSGVVL